MINPHRFENVHQIGGIRTGTLDWPEAAQRVAFFDTGAGLRFTVALDRGGDILDATHQQHALAWLSSAGLRAPSHAYHRGVEWLQGWAGGLMTTCGPKYAGGPREEHGEQTTLHGHYSSQPAQIELLRNPDPQRGRMEMELVLIVRDSRMFGPNYEIRRRIACTLGVPEITVQDEVTNRGDTRVPHHWLYHCNLGYPLLDEGARFVYAGEAQYWIAPPPPGEDILQPLGESQMNALKQVPGGLPEHAGAGERGLIVRPTAAADGGVHVALLNPRLSLALELSYSPQQLPRMAHWQHYGPRGCYVSGLEPFSGSLLGSQRDQHPQAEQFLEPGESREYELRFRVHETEESLRALEQYDGTITTAARNAEAASPQGRCT